MFGQKELRAQHTQLVEQLTLSEASRIELQQQNDVNSKKIATLEKELAQSQKFMDKFVSLFFWFIVSALDGAGPKLRYCTPYQNETSSSSEKCLSQNPFNGQTGTLNR
jgi:hypothetical protein